MDDEKGHDVKIIAVPADRLTDKYQHIRDINDVPAAERRKIEHFFKHYKDLESATGKKSETFGWDNVAKAHEYIEEALTRAKNPAAVPVKPPKP